MKKRKMRVLCVICVFIMLLTSMPDIGISRIITVNAAPSYNVIAAVNYAMTWGGSKRNPAYPQYDSDCSNFVSQCLKAGGLDVYDTWVPTLMDKLANMGFTIIQNPSSDQVEPGDVMFYDTTNTGGANHTTIVTSKVNGVPKITGHTNDVLDGNRTDGSSCYWKYGNITWAAILHTSSINYSNVPKNCEISADRTDIQVGESVTFTYNIDDAAIKGLGVDRDGSRFASVEVNSSRGTVSYKFNEAGVYTCIIEGRNNIGFNCRPGVKITVTDPYSPAKPHISNIDVQGKYGYVNFTWDNVDKATCYNLFIYSVDNLNDALQSHWAIRKNELKTTLPNGKYVAKLCSENETESGNYYTDGDLSYEFTVDNTPEKPDIEKISVDNTNGYVTFKWNDFKNATCYNLFIYSVTDLENPIQSHWAIRKNELTTEITTEGKYVAKLCSENESTLGNYYTDGDMSNEFTIKFEKHEHSFEEKITKTATCIEEGVRTYTCSCGYSYDEAIPKVAHKFTKKEISDLYIKTSATCTEPASYYYKCEMCSAKGTTAFTYGSELGHLWGEWETIVEASCDSKGTEMRECSRCGIAETRNVDVAGHAWNSDYTIDVEPTCNTKGVKSIHCTKCGAKKDIQAIDKIAHSFDTNIIKATTERNGKVVDVCKYCGYESTSRTILRPDTITISNSVFTYNGKVQKPLVKVFDIEGQVIDKSNYSLLYSSGCTKVGEYNVTVLFKGIYSGKITKSYKIVPTATSINKIENVTKGIKITWTKKSCTGYRIYRSINGGSYKQIKSINNSAIYSFVDSGANRNGVKYEYKVRCYTKVNGKIFNSVVSASKLNYYIVANKITAVSIDRTAKIYTKWTKNKIASGYQVQYSTNARFTAPITKTITSPNTVNVRSKGMKKGRKYYVRVRTYKKLSKNYYSSWSPKKTILIK